MQFPRLCPAAALFPAAAVFLSVAEAVVLNASFPTFEAFVQLHGRTYERGSSEFAQRRAAYEAARDAAETHNARAGRRWTAGVNGLWDRTDAELQALRGWDGSARPAGRGAGLRAARAAPRAFLQRGSELPAEKIWSNLAMSRHVRNQGGCGSCWAIATASVLEGHAEIHGKPRTFSAQQIVSCTPNPRQCGGEGGCKGATAELGMDWVLKHGCAEESDVPYAGVDGSCNMGNEFPDPEGSAPKGSALGLVGWETLPKNEYQPLLQSLAERGPVAVSVAASAWQLYEQGVFDGCAKDAVIDHAVTAIGYGEEKGEKYWVIQNSWGEDWGENGHIRLLRHAEGDFCGMNNDPQKGVGCKGETDPVPVCGMCGVLFDSVVPHFSR